MEVKQTNKKWSTGKKLLVGFAVLIVLVAISRAGKSKGSSDAGKSEAPAQTTDQEKPVGLGDALHTEYFDVTIKKAYETQQLETGNQFTDKVATSGQKFVVLEAIFKNTDNESRVITDGKLILVKDGKEYAMEKSEDIMVEGWGIMLKNINPLSALNTNIVYQIPDDFKGSIYYEPARGNGKRINIVGK